MIVIQGITLSMEASAGCQSIAVNRHNWCKFEEPYIQMADYDECNK